MINVGFKSKYWNIVNESFESDISVLKQMGYSLVERKIIGNVVIFLMFGDGAYQIAITSNDSGFITQPDQEKRPTELTVHDIFKIKGQIIQTVASWVDKYIQIYAGSFNEKRTEIYNKILSQVFTTSEINHMPSMRGRPESWFFSIKK